MLRNNIPVSHEIQGDGKGGVFRLGDNMALSDELIARYTSTVKCIYLDPPFLTGEAFCMQVCMGRDDWALGRPSLKLPTFRDYSDRTAYLAMMRRILTVARKLLRDDGLLFLHVDWRTDAHLRIMLDEIFGEENFLNEIIWAYRSGGRARNFFSRKHDTILFYRKTAQYTFDLEPVMITPEAPRDNHMRRHVDPDGRVYRSIRSGGKVYTYYDDDPVPPSDVWTDISHLQQRDPERIGYETQKPVALLRRIILCCTQEGDLVADLFSGSGTTAVACAQTGRRFLCVDKTPLSMNALRRRLEGSYTFAEIPNDIHAACDVEMHMGVGLCEVKLTGFTPAREGLPEAADGLDAVDNWSVGYLRADGYHVMTRFLRTKKTPELQTTLSLPVYAGEAMLCITDIAGRSAYFTLPNE